MTEKSKQMDLCANCLHISHCFYCKTKKAPVHFCEEFACRGTAASVADLERLERAQAQFLPNSKSDIFDDCGKPVSQGN